MLNKEVGLPLVHEGWHIYFISLDVEGEYMLQVHLLISIPCLSLNVCTDTYILKAFLLYLSNADEAHYMILLCEVWNSNKRESGCCF